jgi:L-threonylcarbamoyladenylate synthase
VQSGQWKIRQAALQLLDGKVLAYPAEATWMLGCDPENEAATHRVLAINRQPVDKGLVLVAASVSQIEHLLEGLSRKQRKQLIASWPGPTTWLLPDIDNQVPSWIKGRYECVAVRVTAHSIVAALCESFGGPLVSSSANRNDQPPFRNALQIVKHLGKDIDGILHGSLGGQKSPSTIIDALTGKVLR